MQLYSKFNISFKKTLLLCKLPLKLAEESTLKNKNKKVKIKMEERKKPSIFPVQEMTEIHSSCKRTLCICLSQMQMCPRQ